MGTAFGDSADNRGTDGCTVIFGLKTREPWASCRRILPNLITAYTFAQGGPTRLMCLSWPPCYDEILRAARALLSWKLTALVFLDQNPSYEPLLQILWDLMGDRSGVAFPALRFHLYGNFTLLARTWSSLEGRLRGLPVTFVCASERQARLVSSFLLAPERAVSVCPFPVDTSVFKPDPAAGEAFRRRHGLAAGDKVILYVGRLSLQKNVIGLLKSVGPMLSAHPNWHVFTAGVFDDIGAEPFGIALPRGAMAALWLEALSQFSDSVRKRVHFLDSLEPPRLRELYCASDLFVSLSLHHDEDFGMAPAEALCAGTPALLSDWGGYASFAIDDRFVKMLPATMGPAGPQVEMASFGARVTEFLSAPRSEESRARSARVFADKFSIQAVSASLPSLDAEKPVPFGGFNPKLRDLSRQRPENGAAHLTQGAMPGEMYESIYRHYRRPTA